MHTPAEGSAMLARSTRILVVLMVAVLLGACHEQGLIRHHRKRDHRSHHNRHHVEDSKSPWAIGNALQQDSLEKTTAQTPAVEHVFLSENCSVVLAQTGSTPILHCEVADIGEGTVSWIRRKDFHLLTVGLATYSSDERFFTAHVHNQQDWALHVRFSQEADAGLYECQVSTHPPISLFVELQLVEARAELLGGPDKFVKRGSTLRLVCVLRRATEPPSYVFWYHGGRMVNYDSARGLQVRHGRFSSELTVEEAQREHSGNYSCVPSNARAASIAVHVINGEEPAAMQHGSKGSSANLFSDSACTFCLTALSLCLLTLQER